MFFDSLHPAVSAARVSTSFPWRGTANRLNLASSRNAARMFDPCVGGPWPVMSVCSYFVRTGSFNWSFPRQLAKTAVPWQLRNTWRDGSGAMSRTSVYGIANLYYEFPERHEDQRRRHADRQCGRSSLGWSWRWRRQQLG